MSFRGFVSSLLDMIFSYIQDDDATLIDILFCLFPVLYFALHLDGSATKFANGSEV